MINIGPSIYIPTDKNIFDAILHKKITAQELGDFLLERGIIVSEDLSKQELARMVSQLTLDYHDFTKLKSLLENPNKKEKSSSTTLKADSSQDDITKLCHKIARNSSDDNESYKVVKHENTTSLVVSYTDIDFTKTELRQRTSMTCIVELESNGNEIIVRQPASKKGNEIFSKVKDALENEKGEALNEEKVSLENIIFPEARSYFFDRLINLLEGYELEDVTSIDVYHHIDDLTGDDDDDDDEISENITGYIRKAVLSGGGVLTSSEFSQLHNKGFFISKIIWKAIDKLPQGDMIEFEALFGDAASCTDYKYLVRGVYNYKEKTGMHNVTRRAASRIEVSSLTKKLEEASKKAYTSVLQRYVETSS